MGRYVCVANQKGGVGKTTTAVNLAAGLAHAGSEVLLIDIDPQCNATSSLGARATGRHPLLSGQPLRDLICQTQSARLSLLPGSHSFEDLSLLAEGENAGIERVCETLSNGSKSYDYVLIDCPPSLGRLTEMALTSATEVLIPIQCEYFAMEGLTQMIEVIRRAMQRPSSQLQFGGILLTMVDDTLELTHEVDREVREFFGEIVFDTVIPRDVAVSEAPSHCRSVIEHAPRARGARAYIELCMEVMERE